MSLHGPSSIVLFPFPREMGTPSDPQRQSWVNIEPRLVVGGTKESEVREPARPGRQTDKSVGQPAHSPASGVRGGGLVVTSVTSRTSLGSGEGKRLGPQGWVLVKDLTTGPTPDTEKSKVTEKCPNLGERRRREGRRETHPGRSAWSLHRKSSTVTQARTKTSPWEAPAPAPALHLQLCWRTWVTAPGRCLLTEGLQHPSSAADNRTGDPERTAVGTLEAGLPEEGGVRPAVPGCCLLGFTECVEASLGP